MLPLLAYNPCLSLIITALGLALGKLVILLQDPCDGVIKAAVAIPEISLAVRRRDEEKIDYPTDEQKPEVKNQLVPVTGLFAVVEPVRACEPEGP